MNILYISLVHCIVYNNTIVPLQGWWYQIGQWERIYPHPGRKLCTDYNVWSRIKLAANECSSIFYMNALLLHEKEVIHNSQSITTQSISLCMYEPLL